jgi:hypothetical protein
MVLYDQKTTYLESLRQSDAGNHQSFVDFVARRVAETVELLTTGFQAAAAPAVADALARLEGLYQTRGGFSQAALDRAGSQVLDALAEEFDRQVAGVTMPEIVVLKVNRVGGGYRSDRNDYRAPAPPPTHVAVSGASKPPIESNFRWDYIVLIPRDCGEDDALRIRSEAHGRELTARVSELMPSLSHSLLMKVRLYVQSELGHMLAHLHEAGAAKVGRTTT